MVYRVYVEKRAPYDEEAQRALAEFNTLPGISGLTGLRLLNRYDVEGIDEPLFKKCLPVVFSEPQIDDVMYSMPEADAVFAVEYLPGQFDQRADSCAECIQLVSRGERPEVLSAKVYLLYGEVSEEALEAIKHYVINPVESREASLDERASLAVDYPEPADVQTVEGFTALDADGLTALISRMGLAMDVDDAECCRAYFERVGRDPTVTELRVLDTYWSDHCRHTTFGTVIDEVEIDDPDVRGAYDAYLRIRRELGRSSKPMTLMDIATIGAKCLKKRGMLQKLDESEEINACSVKITVDNDGVEEPWLLMFKNETHNHPTEIEPFGGAATCIGGAIRDPLSGRSYVYQAMRVTGAGDPTVPLEDTLPGKLPQRKLCTGAAAGYSSYGNQIGLATGLVDELYHPGYVAKRLEIGAVVAAAPENHVVRMAPEPGDVVILLGGRTGRDGMGGATGSSKAHDSHSLTDCGAEVQKGNAPVERKLQRLFRDGDVTRMIKRCNDFGAGGVSVAIGELAPGLDIDLDRVKLKYAGLDGTELAISESQERMAVVVSARNEVHMLQAAERENLEATTVARVSSENRLRMIWRGRIICDIDRDFLDTNGAEKHTRVHVPASGLADRSPAVSGAALEEKLCSLLGSLECCSRRGLAERFDSTIGAGTVLMPFGGKNQLTPAQCMAAKIPVRGETGTCSAMAWGFEPRVSEQSTFKGAYLAVAESISRLVASGFGHKDVYLSFQEYFERLRTSPERWGKPFAALLGALKAQIDFGAAAIGGKDSMSGSFEELDVPPTLVSFAVAAGKASDAVSPEFKRPGDRVALLHADVFDAEATVALWEKIEGLMKEGKVRAAWSAGCGGLGEGLAKMCFGNGLGVKLDEGFDTGRLFGWDFGSFILELDAGCAEGETMGFVTSEYAITAGNETVSLDRVQRAWETRLESVYPHLTAPGQDAVPVEKLSYSANTRVKPLIHIPRPHALIPVFPGTNCEYDTARALERAGAEAEILVVRNLTSADVEDSLERMADALSRSQMLVIPGGFSGGDEPDGSGKLINAFFRSPKLTDAVHELLNKRDGLILGICNGFQALIKLGLVPFGKIVETDSACPTLTYNAIGRHQSRLVRTRVCSNLSPWLSKCSVGDIHTVAISHGEGRFICPPELLSQLRANGQLATQYVDLDGEPSMDLRYDPNGSVLAVEGITSPDGRVFGKMGHTERAGSGLYANVPGLSLQPLFEGGVEYFK